MSAVSRRLEDLGQKIRALHEQEEKAQGKRKWGLRAVRWGLMLYHQFISDDVRIRAESLTFLITFSILPLIAGAFFVFSIFSKFGMVQQALMNGLSGFLDTIPDEHRGFVQDYVLRFKDAYLAAIDKKSGTLGIFALFFLIWVGMKFYANIERTLNHIWSADRERNVLEQLRDFLVVSVAAPIVITAGLSLPLVLHNLPGTRYVLQQLPILSTLLSDIIPALLIFLTFAALYRYVPVRRVQWRSALVGAVFSTIFLQLTNAGMRVYFRYGTNSAYGKAAVIPLVGFWIYLSWIVVILGVEVSYLMQNEREILAASPHDPTLREGEALLMILSELGRAFREGRNPIAYDELQTLTGLRSSRLRLLIKYGLKKRLILECSPDGVHLDGHYVLAQDLPTIPLAPLLADFYGAHASIDAGPLGQQWMESIRRWTGSFDKISL